jgi:type I restriction enzyme M protein
VPKLLWKTAGIVNSQYDVIVKILVPLLKNLGFDDCEMEFEKPLAGQMLLQIGSKKISVKRPDIFVKVGERPVMVVEAKSPDETISVDAIGQAVSYAVMFGTPFALVSNGQVMELFKVESLVSYQQLDNVLTKKELEEAITPKFGIQEKEEAKRTLVTFKEKKEFANVFNTCHDIIRTQKGLGAKERLYEMCKILFVKWNEEDRFYKEMAENRFTMSVFDDMEERGIDAKAFMNDTLFEFTKTRLTGIFDGEAISIFDKDEKIELESHTIRELLRELERYTLSQTGEDIIGVAFETFLRGTMTGRELGEFFTPRELVDFMVNLAKPKIGERVIDPACGSGGFLIRVYKKICKDIESLAVDKIEKMKYSEDLINHCLWGIDIDRSLAKLSQANLIFHGNGFGHIYQHNAFIGSEVGRITKNQKFNLVLTNPPFGRGKGKDVTDSEILKHYRLGRNRQKQSPQILFIELCLGLLEDGGRLLTVIDDGILNNSTLSYVRDFIKEQAIIKAVVSLPRGTFNPYGSGVKSSVLYVQKKTNLTEKKDKIPPEKQGDVFMAIANYVGFDTRRRTRYVQIDKNDLLNIETVGMKQIK